MFWSITQEPLGLLKFLCNFWVPRTIYYKMHKLFFIKMLIILRLSTKHVNFWLEVQYPLNTDSYHPNKNAQSHLYVPAQSHPYLSGTRIQPWTTNIMYKLQPFPVIVGCLTDTTNTPGFFSWGGLGGPPIRQKFCQSPHPTLVPVFGPRLVPPSRRSSPKIWKIQIHFCVKFDYFKLKSTFKSCISCLK